MSAFTGWIFFILLVLTIGSVGLRWAIIPRATGLPDPEEQTRTAARIGLVAALALVPAFLALLHRQVNELRFPGDPWLDAARTILGTSWGDAWWLAVAGLVLVIAGFGLASTGKIRGVYRRLAWGMATLALLPVAFFPGRTGHANAAEPQLLHLSLDALHVVAAGLWIGGLGTILMLAWWDGGHDSDSGGGGTATTLAALIPAFSPVAMASVAILFASGTWAAWRELDSVSALWGSGYGRLLSVKVFIVGGVLILGAINWKRLSGGLGSRTGDRAMKRSATVEFFLANVVLIVTAILVRTSP